jgi:hypothetical protein
VWSRAADIYGLSSTLVWLLDPSDSSAPDLKPSLERGLSHEPQHRPAAEELLAIFEELEQERRLEERRNQLWWEIYNAVGKDRHVPWFSSALHRYRSTLVGLAMGSHRHWIERVGVLAEFLNQVVEAYPKDRTPLRALKTTSPVHGLELGRSISALRAGHVHAREAHNEETRATLNAFKALDEPRQREVVSAGIELVAGHCRLPSLPVALERLLTPVEVRNPKEQRP